MEINIKYCSQCSNTMSILGLNFECLNCKFQLPIENGTVIYSKKKEITSVSQFNRNTVCISSASENLRSKSFLKHSNIYSITYRMCENPACSGGGTGESKTVVREKKNPKPTKHRKIVNDNNEVNYLCTECNYY
jgi:hypothetical protein